MTTEENNKTLGILHLVYGGLHALLVFVFMFILIPLFIGIGSSGRHGDAQGALFMTVFFSIFAFFGLVFTIPSLVAGYGLLKRKSWAKVWSIIAGGVAGMSFPLGTALCVYTFWFLFSGGGKELYDDSAPRYGMNQPGTLHGAPQPAEWAERNRKREYTYAPPFEPPNWRGE
jgi:hypothetical protein